MCPYARTDRVPQNPDAVVRLRRARYRRVGSGRLPDTAGLGRPALHVTDRRHVVIAVFRPAFPGAFALVSGSHREQQSRGSASRSRTVAHVGGMRRLQRWGSSGPRVRNVRAAVHGRWRRCSHPGRAELFD